jgi:glycosyltransferase involved in cell wall biosynthesis
VGAALRSLSASTFRSWEAIVVDDASRDDSLAVAADWVSEERRPALLVHHSYNRGLPSARNTALSLARGEFCFILDADNELFPHCLERLVDALDRDPGAVFAYGALERFHGGSTVGIGNRLPWEPARLRTSNFVDAMALIRTDYLREVGGYTTDRRLHGWEDYDLWCATAERGQRGTYVPEILARYRSVMHSMVSTTNLSTTDAYSVLIERYPELMAGVEPPL